MFKLTNLFSLIILVWLLFVSFKVLSLNRAFNASFNDNSISNQSILTKLSDIEIRLSEIEVKQNTLQNKGATRKASSISNQKVFVEKKTNSSEERQRSVSKAESEKLLLNVVREMRKEKDFTQIVASKYESEIIDPNWSSEYESDIQELFAFEPELSGATLKQVLCKSEICKVELYPHQGVDGIDFSSNFASVLSKQKWRDSDSSFIFDHNPVDGVLVFYLGKDKNSLFTEK